MKIIFITVAHPYKLFSSSYLIMSTFGGIIKEIEGISVDRFDGENVHSSAFFLSHCHKDHMNGLETLYFQNEILSKNKYVYLSSVSAVILRALVPKIADQIRELPLEQITSVLVGNKHISLTCIPAGHCPGSVMFLFETNDVRILYTGDYRINSTDIKKFKCFYDTFGSVKLIDKIYLDTTFFLESYLALPKRQDSLSELCRIIQAWISQSPENCIKLDARAKYGYEYVFKEIYDFCKMPVHVDIDRYKFYSVIPELKNCVTTDASLTQIHNCRYGQLDVCDFCNIDKTRIIKLSAFRWQNDDLKNGISQVGESGIFYVCYSTHASYEEGIALIHFLKPKDIHICVERPNDPIATLNIKKLVEKELKKVKGEYKKTESPKLFCVNTKSIQSIEHSRLEDANTSPPPQKIFKTESVLDSPPR